MDLEAIHSGSRRDRTRAIEARARKKENPNEMRLDCSFEPAWPLTV